MFRKFTSERVRRARRRRMVVFSILYTLLGLSVVLVLWQLSYAPFLRIDRVFISGTRSVSHRDVFDTVTPFLSGAHAGVFSRRNTFLYERSDIQNKLFNMFPRIQDVVVTTDGAHTLLVTVTEHEPEALVCRTQSQSECYFLNKEGFVFSEAPDFLGDSYVSYIAALDENPIGKWFLSSRDGFSPLHLFVRSLEKFSLYPRDVYVSKDSITVVARVQSDTVRIILSTTMPYEETYRNLEAVLHEKNFSITSVESIDLRFGNKVFFREEVGEEATSDSAL